MIDAREEEDDRHLGRDIAKATNVISPQAVAASHLSTLCMMRALEQVMR
jgi:hypothetical protein